MSSPECAADVVIKEVRQTYPPLITLREAATIARRPLKTIYDWSHRGFFDKFKTRCGKSVQLVRDRFIEFLFTDPPQYEG